MKGSRELWSVLVTIAWLAAVSAIGRSAVEAEFTKDGKSFKYVWGQFLDAQVIRTEDGRGAQVYALRSGVLKQKGFSEFLELRRVIGLWRASLDSTGKVGKTELVQDVTTHVLETYNLIVVPQLTSNTRMMSACTDPAGQVHVFLAISAVPMASNGYQNRLFYLRKKGVAWKEMLTGPLGDYWPVNLTSFVAGNDVYFFYMQGIKESDVPIIWHSLPINHKMETPQWRLFGAPGPAQLQADVFTAFANGRNPVVVFREDGNTAFNVARWDDSRRSWDIQKNVLSPRINNALVGNGLNGLSGFAAADGTLHVFAVNFINQLNQPQIIHLSCAGDGNHWDSEVILSQGADWVSAVTDTAGRVDLIGVTKDGAIWHSRRPAKGVGVILDENTK